MLLFDSIQSVKYIYRLLQKSSNDSKRKLFINKEKKSPRGAGGLKKKKRHAYCNLRAINSANLMLEPLIHVLENFYQDYLTFESHDHSTKNIIDKSL